MINLINENREFVINEGCFYSLISSRCLINERCLNINLINGSCVNMFIQWTVFKHNLQEIRG